MNIIKELCLLHFKYWIICFGCCRFLPKYACLCVCLNLFFISLINNVWWGIVILRLYRCEIAQRNVNLKTSFLCIIENNGSSCIWIVDLKIKDMGFCKPLLNLNFVEYYWVLVGEIGMANLVVLSTRLTIIDTKRIWGRKQYLWIISCIMKAEMFFILLICLAFFKNYYYCCLHVTSIDVLPLW